MNDWKKVEEWLYSHDCFDASRNMRDIKHNRDASELLREYHLYDILEMQRKQQSVHPKKAKKHRDK